MCLEPRRQRFSCMEYATCLPCVARRVVQAVRTAISIQSQGSRPDDWRRGNKASKWTLAWHALHETRGRSTARFSLALLGGRHGRSQRPGVVRQEGGIRGRVFIVRYQTEKCKAVACERFITAY